MANPIIRPTTPIDDLTEDKSFYGSFSFSVDDTDSSIDIDTLGAMGFYSAYTQENYDFSDRVLGNFRDTGANPTKTSFVDVAQFSDKRIEMTVTSADGDFNSALFFPTDNKYTNGIGFSVKLSVPSFSTTASYTARPYYPSSNFTGVSFGIFDLHTGNAVIVFLNSSQELVVAGPASDGVGTRVASSSISYNWTIESTFSIFIDYKLDIVTVTAATAESGEDTVLWTGSATSLGFCLESLALGNKYKTINSDVLAFVSQDGREVGDLVIIREFELYDIAYRYITNGSLTSSTASGSFKTRDSLLGPSKEVHNFTNLKKTQVKLYKSGVYDAIEFTAAAGSLTSHYEDLDNNQFFLCTSLHLTENSFAGVNSGVGIDILGSKQFSIRYLDGYIGLRTSNDVALIRTLGGYETYAIDPKQENYFIFYSDGTTFRAFLLKNGSYVSMFTFAVANLPNSTETALQFSSEAGLSGVLFVADFIFSSTTREAILPSLNTCTTVPQGSFTYAIVAPTTSISTVFAPSTSQTSISGAYMRIPKYAPDHSGLVCVYKATITPTTPIQPETNHGPLLLLNTDSPSANVVTHAMHLMVTKANDGHYYLYIPGDAQDVREVAYQTNKGKSISTKIDSLSIHVCIKYDPFSGVYIYDMANNFSLVLQVPKLDIDGSHKLLPDINSEGVYLPTDVATDAHFTAAIGVLDTSSIKVSVDLCLVGTGRGLDVSFFKNTEIINTHALYGTTSRLLVTAGDND